jgi:ketosteroid isomerase-like protein
MMSAEELVRAIIESIEQHDLNRAGSYMTDDAVVRDPKLPVAAVPKTAFWPRWRSFCERFQIGNTTSRR